MPTTGFPAFHIETPPGCTGHRLACKIRHAPVQPSSSSCASRACGSHRCLRCPHPRRPSTHPCPIPLPSCAYMSPEWRALPCPRYRHPCDPWVVAYERAQLRVAAANDIWTSLAQQVEVEVASAAMSAATLAMVSVPLLDGY